MSYVNHTVDFSYIKRIAIAPLVNLSDDKNAGGKVMNVIATDVLRRGVFDVVEFGEVYKVMREEGLNEPETLSQHIVAKAGKKLDVQAFITGSVMEYGASRTGNNSVPEVSLSLKLIDVNTYAILWDSTHNIKGSNVFDQLFGINKETPEDLCKELVTDIFDTLFG